MAINDGKSDEVDDFQSYIKELIKASKTIMVTFGGNALSSNPIWEDATSLIMAPVNDNAYTLAAQAIFGGTGISGKAANAYGDFPKGSGLMTQSIERLRYSPAAEVGMDAQLLNDSIAAIIKEGIEAGAFPGAQVLVAKDGHVIYHEAFGYQTFDNNKPITTQDIYDFASVSKVTTALSAVILYGLLFFSR